MAQSMSPSAFCLDTPTPTLKRSSRFSLPGTARGAASPQSRIPGGAIAQRKIFGKNLSLSPGRSCATIRPLFRLGALIKRKVVSSSIIESIEVCAPERPPPFVTHRWRAVAPDPPPPFHQPCRAEYDPAPQGLPAGFRRRSRAFGRLWERGRIADNECRSAQPPGPSPAQQTGPALNPQKAGRSQQGGNGRRHPVRRTAARGCHERGAWAGRRIP
jgi:hypothetical protein